MGKHLDKVLKALEKRREKTEAIKRLAGKGASGYHTPGSMNKRKTGYSGKGKR